VFKKLSKIILNIVFTAIFLFGLLVIYSALPFSYGLKIYTVQSGSMEPVIKTGSVIFVLPSREYNIGNIVTRTSENNSITVTHRIVERNGNEFTTKGDANNAVDPLPLEQSSIVGKYLFQIPYLGYPIGFARTTRGLLLLIIIPSLFIIFDEAMNIKNELKKMKQKKIQPQTPLWTRPTANIKYQRMNTPIRILSIDTAGIPKDIRHLCL